MKTLIIAECGVNHNGDLSLAKKLIEFATEAKADIVKFQTFTADGLVTQHADKAEYQKNKNMKNESQYSMLKKLELNKEAHLELLTHCERNQINFLSTGFDIDSLNLLNSIGQKQFKVPSGEITNLPYLRHVGKFKKPIILSTGMSNLKEVEVALKVFEEAGTLRSLITVLHCTSAYPAPKHDVNLLAMLRIKEEFGVAVGYSDHTLGTEIAIAAATLGASIIEKHFTLDRNLPGPDHKASLEPEEFEFMVNAIRNIGLAMGDGVKRPMPSEVENKNISRKSLVAIKNIKIGEEFTDINIAAKRPGNGISPMKWDQVIGRSAKRNYILDELIDDEA